MARGPFSRPRSHGCWVDDNVVHLLQSQFEQGTAEVSFLRDTEHLEEERWSQAEQFVAEARQRLNDVTAKIIEEV